MKLTTFSDYSLRTLMFLAVHEDRQVTIAEIAAAFGISEHHLVKVVHFLGRHGWVTTTRGRNGGARLARPAGALGLGEVLRATEGEEEVVACEPADGPRCRIARACALRGVLAEAQAAFFAVLDRHTLDDVLANRAQLQRVLLTPAPERP